MASTLLRIVSGSQLTTSLATYGTAVGTGRRQRIDKCTVCNSTATARWFDFHLVPSGGSADATNQLIDGKVVAAGETYTCPEVVGHTMEAGGFIRAVAEAATALTLMVSGVEIS